jgi:Uma2 family endonuclease
MDYSINVSSLPSSFVGKFSTKNGSRMSDEEFFRFCQQNPDLQIEQNKEGEIITMPPTGGITGTKNFGLTVLFGNWLEKHENGVGFDSSTMFVLPNEAKRSSDLSWILTERWESLTAEEQEKFPPLCPDFVVELRSRIDSLKSLREKMEEYIENGAKLGWLIDPIKRKVHIYRSN